MLAFPRAKSIFGGCIVEDQHIIQQEIGFVIGNMSFKYLGVPLASRKLTINMCQPLIDKMMSRLNHWSTRLLTYVGRIQLIRSVLFSIANFWLQIFPLPEKVIHHIEGLCRSFLWIGKECILRKALISWDHTCDPIAACGMNLIVE